MKHNQTYINNLLNQYRAGTISKTDRQELERIALDDPFLFDALEAYTYSKATADQQSIDQIKRNISKPSGRIVSMRNLSIAAGVVILIGGIVWLQGSFDNRNDSVVSQSIDRVTELSEEVENESLQEDPSDFVDVQPEDISSNSSIVEEPNSVIRPTLKEAATPQANMNESKTTAPIEAINRTEVVSSTENEKTDYDYRYSSTTLSSKSDQEKELAQNEQTDPFDSEESENIDSNSIGLKRSEAIQAIGEYQTRSKSRMAPSPILLSGKVTDVTGEPLIGAEIMLGNTLITSDTKGSFRFNQFDSTEQKLRVSYLGYNDFELILPDSNLTDVAIVLEEDEAVLDEVVIVGAGAAENIRSNDQPYVVPPKGRTVFKRYVKDEAIKNGCSTKGKVKLKFVIDIYGEPQDFEVKKGLSDECNKAAIEIIKNGGRWDNQFLKAKTVRYTVTFD